MLQDSNTRYLFLEARLAYYKLFVLNRRTVCALFRFKQDLVFRLERCSPIFRQDTIGIHLCMQVLRSTSTKNSKNGSPFRNKRIGIESRVMMLNLGILIRRYRLVLVCYTITNLRTNQAFFRNVLVITCRSNLQEPAFMKCCNLMAKPMYSPTETVFAQRCKPK